MSRAFNFNGFDLQAAPYSVIDTDAFSSPEREVISHELARSDNAVSVFRKYKSRVINLSGLIADSTSDLVDAEIDAIKFNLMNGGKGVLNIGWAGGTRSWGAEVINNFITRKNNDVTRANYSAQLFCEKAYATNGQTGTLITSTLAANTVYAVAVDSTFMVEPVLVFTINSIATAGLIDITIGNPASSEYITIPKRNVVAGDTITVDTNTKQVFHNTTLVPATGYFPGWAPGNGSIEYTDTAAARNISLVGTYEKRYL